MRMKLLGKVLTVMAVALAVFYALVLITAWV